MREGQLLPYPCNNGVGRRDADRRGTNGIAITVSLLGSRLAPTIDCRSESHGAARERTTRDTANASTDKHAFRETIFNYLCVTVNIW
ncbi:unnamed protein product [Leptidea sinapis]|uniref:Uncharacterized protein n=1 Tax=Leptidea sinapis TaxID=189913 RepID=A0A5E4QTM8_9NEOP|nr:unnamed protein product [Leptidea sinapis]